MSRPRPILSGSIPSPLPPQNMQTRISLLGEGRTVRLSRAKWLVASRAYRWVGEAIERRPSEPAPPELMRQHRWTSISRGFHMMGKAVNHGVSGS